MALAPFVHERLAALRDGVRRYGAARWLVHHLAQYVFVGVGQMLHAYVGEMYVVNRGILGHGQLLGRDVAHVGDTLGLDLLNGFACRLVDALLGGGAAVDEVRVGIAAE